MKNFLTSVALLATCSFYAQTIYTGDGSLSSNRLVTMASRSLQFKSNSSTFFINGTTGYTGINTTTPTQYLDVNGNIKGLTGFFNRFGINGSYYPTNTERIRASLALSAGTIVDPGGAGTFTFMDMGTSNMEPAPLIWLDLTNRDNMSRLRFRAVQGGDSNFLLYDKNQQINFQIVDYGNDHTVLTMPKANSYLGIGTTSFTDGTDTFKLSVDGNIRAKRIKVYTTWADYVFEDNYDLPTLPEVEQYIKENGHLQDIPSAAEVEEKGIELGEMNKLLLQKIEELTLYTIELNKQVQELKSQLNKK
jgi:hypothetical protein